MITLIPYQIEWQQCFEEEKEKLEKILAPYSSFIEHIGSTAIPDIYAKPVIDILIGISNFTAYETEIINRIESLGYIYNSKFEDEFPYRRYLQKNDNEAKRTHQIHLVNYPSAWFEKHILFRNYLRTHAEAAQAYSNHKLKLAAEFDDSLAYAHAKTDFCLEIVKQAFFDFSTNIPFITTERLLGFIPQLCANDLYQDMFTDKDFIECFGVAFDKNKIHSVLTKQLDLWNQHGYGSWVWFEKSTYKFVGEGGLNITTVEEREEIELTYSLNKNFWGKGYAKEISKATLDYAFNKLNLSNIVCFTSENNFRSLNVMQKLGFIFEKNFTYAGIPHLLFRLKSYLPHNSSHV